MRIGQVAERAGVKTSLIRYYEDLGLLPDPLRIGGQRRYDGSVLRRLAVIDVAQRAGMSLEEIKLLVEHGSAPVSDGLQDLAARKLPEVRALIERARRVEQWLQDATACACSTIDECTLFDEPAPEQHAVPFRLPVSRIGSST